LGRQLHTPHTAYRYKRALALVVESGSVYSVAVLIELVLYLANSNAFYIVYDPIAQLTVSVRILHFANVFKRDGTGDSTDYDHCYVMSGSHLQGCRPSRTTEYSFASRHGVFSIHHVRCTHDGVDDQVVIPISLSFTVLLLLLLGRNMYNYDYDFMLRYFWRENLSTAVAARSVFDISGHE